MEYNRVTNINFIFRNCSSVTKLPDISIWDIRNIKYMNDIFNGCFCLIKIPDISKWSINKEVASNPINISSSYSNSIKSGSIIIMI